MFEPYRDPETGEVYSAPDFLMDIENMPPEQPKEINPTDSINEFRIDYFYYNINNLDKLDANTRTSFIKANIDLISEHIANATCKYGNALYSTLFLESYLRVLNMIPITPLRKLAANRLAYIFQTNWPSKKLSQDDRQAIDNLFYSITRVVNTPYVLALENEGVPTEMAIQICKVRFASTDELINAHRVNQAILFTRDPSVMTEQLIIYIYEKLFDQMRYLFCATMLDLHENYENEYPDDEDAIYYVFSNIGLAVLTMANNMPMNDIKNLLEIFLDKWISVGRPMTRFSLRVLSADFSRVLAVVEDLLAKGVYVP